MIVTSSSQCSLTNVCDAASSAVYRVGDDMLLHLTVLLIKSVRDSDYSVKYLSDFSKKSPGDPSSLN